MFKAAGVAPEWMNYEGYPEYPQLHGGFEHAVTALDLLFNTGAEAPRYSEPFGLRSRSTRSGSFLRNAARSLKRKTSGIAARGFVLDLNSNLTGDAGGRAMLRPSLLLTES